MIADMFYQLLGNGIFMTSFIILFFVILLTSVRANNPAIMLSVLAPLIFGLILNSRTTNFIDIPAWISFPIFMIIGTFFAMALIWLFSNK